MDNTSSAICAGREPTCAHGRRLVSDRVYVGTADGSVRAIAVPSLRDDVRRPSDAELPLMRVYWSARLCIHAITNVCGVDTDVKHTDTLLVGSAGGELVVLREELEVRRFQLEGGVQDICYTGNGVFMVGDALGNLYCVTQYEILWKQRLPAIVDAGNDAGLDFFYPAATQPIVYAIAQVRLLDVERTLSNYVLVASGHKHVVVTHCGKTFAAIPTRTPMTTLAVFPGKDEDIVLAAGEEGLIYRLVSNRDVVSNEMPDFRFAMEVWVKTSFPVMKLLSVPTPSKVNVSEIAWVCLGSNGEVALFRGQECVRTWEAASFSTARSAAADFPVDLTLLASGDASDVRQSGVIVFRDRIHTFPIDLMGQQ
ncbi:unnamed protein product [Hyaloperonospora brassicae]|uniref:Uncharacterized protein n=1 Tax=Hyaloperonospora brassicae TaxID=162125 RepID=A0AAV0TRN3_HYABA|nr:unnamed protein product [Hyaloperonospora brassicae]